MKKLPLGIQNFKEIATGNYLYVDKTQHIYNLVGGAKYYFLSRPRRFGKSLLLDTIGEAFGGEKELFKGLWIYDSDYGFPKHPVVRLDMSNIANETPQILEDSLLDELKTIAEDEDVALADGNSVNAFKRLIRSLHKKHGQKVVVLIDEYDKPILDHIADIKTADANRQALRGFYGILKSMDPHLRFVFITGVSKFTKTSIFSGLNNLSDITMSKKHSAICGITIEELDKYFDGHIKHISALEDFSRYEDIHGEILKWYDGYSWDGKTRVINPFSLLNFFDQEKFAGFWYASGSPRFLLDLIKDKPESYMNLRNARISENMLDSVDIEKIAIEPLLFLTGYLTVQEIQLALDDLFYHLRIPNNEVRRAFSLHILSSLAESDDVRTDRMRLDAYDALKTGDLQKLLE